MGEYKHQNRKLRVNTPLGPDELILTGFYGTEAISTLFGYRLEMVGGEQDEGRVRRGPGAEG